MPISTAKLRQRCTVAIASNDYRGVREYQPIWHDVPCRAGQRTQTNDTGEGELNEFLSYIHLPPDRVVNKGEYILLNSRTYMIEKATLTYGRNGEPFMQYCELTEVYGV